MILLAKYVTKREKWIESIEYPSMNTKWIQKLPNSYWLICIWLCIIFATIYHRSTTAHWHIRWRWLAWTNRCCISIKKYFSFYSVHNFQHSRIVEKWTIEEWNRVTFRSMLMVVLNRLTYYHNLRWFSFFFFGGKSCLCGSRFNLGKLQYFDKLNRID